MWDLFVADRWWSEWIPATGQFGLPGVSHNGSQNGSVFRFGFGHRVRAVDNFALLANFGLHHWFFDRSADFAINDARFRIGEIAGLRMSNGTGQQEAGTR